MDILAVAGLAVATGFIVETLIAPAVEERETAAMSAVEQPNEARRLNAASTQPQAPSAHAAILRKENDGHYWANANVDGTSVKFMVDTGASTVALTYKDAQRIGLEPDTLSYRWSIRTAGGEVFGASVLLESIKIGQVEVENVEAMVLRDGLTQSLLGMTFLGELQSYEFRQSNLLLRK